MLIFRSLTIFVAFVQKLHFKQQKLSKRYKHNLIFFVVQLSAIEPMEISCGAKIVILIEYRINGVEKTEEQQFIVKG